MGCVQTEWHVLCSLPPRSLRTNSGWPNGSPSTLRPCWLGGRCGSPQRYPQAPHHHDSTLWFCHGGGGCVCGSKALGRAQVSRGSRNFLCCEQANTASLTPASTPHEPRRHSETSELTLFGSVLSTTRTTNMRWVQARCARRARRLSTDSTTHFSEPPSSARSTTQVGRNRCAEDGSDRMKLGKSAIFAFHVQRTDKDRSHTH